MKSKAKKLSAKLPCGRDRPPLPAAPTEEKLEIWKSRLRDFLASHSLKFTEQRWSIARLILETGGHLDAQGLVAKVKGKHPAIGAATVYRSIKVLCDAGLLELSHQDIAGRAFYELPNESHHDHIICTDCGQVFEFHDDVVEARQAETASSRDFELTGHRHVILARCRLLGSAR